MHDELEDLLKGLWLTENSALWQEDEKIAAARIVGGDWAKRGEATLVRMRKIRDLVDRLQVEAHERGLSQGRDEVAD